MIDRRTNKFIEELALINLKESKKDLLNHRQLNIYSHMYTLINRFFQSVQRSGKWMTERAGEKQCLKVKQWFSLGDNVV